MKSNIDRNHVYGKVVLILLLMLLANYSILPSVSHAGLVGSNIAIANKEYDQQNPDVIYLPDQNLWFTVWEDWGSSAGTKSNIYGRFISVNADGSGALCGNAFQITNATGNQTVPKAAYRLGDKIVVAWQDTRGNGTGGYVYYTAITSFPNPASCGSFVPPAATGGTSLLFNGTFKAVVNENETPTPNQVNLGYGTGGTQLLYTGTIPGPVVPAQIDNINVYLVSGGIQTLAMSGTTSNGNASSTLSGPLGAGAVVYNTGAVTLEFFSPVPTNTYILIQYDYYFITFTEGPDSPVNDTLKSRTAPRITYDLVNDLFAMTWVESRSTLNRISEPCFGMASINWTFGDTVFPGYVMLDGATLAPQTNDINVTGPDIIRNDVVRTNRKVSTTSSALLETYTYEYFTSLNNITLASDTTAPETLFVWEGVRQKAVLTCNCQDVNNDQICDYGDIITSTLTTSPYDDGNVHIYSLWDNQISQGVINSMKLDSGTATAHYPSVGFDPISDRFLAAWEDMRGGPNTKVYGGLVESGGAQYNSDFIISYEDLNNDGQNDSNVVNSKQTKPYVSYDPVNQRFFVAWQDGRNSTLSLENLDIYGQKIDAEGSLRGYNFPVCVQPADQYAPALAYNNTNDEFLAAWKDARNATVSTCTATGGTGGAFPCGADIYGQIFGLENPSLTLLNPNLTPLSPPLLNNFQNPAGSGVVQVGLTASQSFLVMNTGDTLLNIQTIYNGTYSCPTCGLNITTPYGFSFSGLPSQLQDPCCLCNSDCQNLSLVPGATLQLTVQFAPTKGGSDNTSFTIASDGGNATVNLSALATEADIEISSPLYTASGMTFTYPNTSPSGVPVGSYEDQTFVVKNIGVASLIISSLTAPTSPFSVQSDGCSGQTVAAGATCSIVVRFAPSAGGLASSSFTINSTAVNYSAFTLNIRGTGAVTPSITVSPLTIPFGNVQVGQTSPSQIITITSTGLAPLTVGPISGPAAPFTMTQNCYTAPATTAILNPTASCQIIVQVKPAAAGGVSGTITIPSNDPVKGSPGVAVSLSANGVTTPQISVNPTILNFPSTVIGITATQTVNVTNVGTANLQITSITNPSPDFSITGSNCIGTLIPGSPPCTITVAFSPSKTGTQSSSFVINSNDPVNPAFTVNLSGIGSSSGGAGLLPQIQVSPNPPVLNFGTIAPGQVSAAQTITVTNLGPGNLIMGTTQPPGAPFFIIADSCSGRTITNLGTCKIVLEFAPLRRAAYTYYMYINSNDPNNPKITVTLQGL